MQMATLISFTIVASLSGWPRVSVGATPPFHVSNLQAAALQPKLHGWAGARSLRQRGHPPGRPRSVPRANMPFPTVDLSAADEVVDLSFLQVTTHAHKRVVKKTAKAHALQETATVKGSSAVVKPARSAADDKRTVHLLTTNYTHAQAVNVTATLHTLAVNDNPETPRVPAVNLTALTPSAAAKDSAKAAHVLAVDDSEPIQALRAFNESLRTPQREVTGTPGLSQLLREDAANGNPWGDLWNSIKAAGKEIGDGVSDVAKDIEDGVTKAGTAAAVWALGTMGKLPNEKPADLGGHSRRFCNTAATIMVGALITAAAVGHVLDRWLFPESSKGRSGATVILCLLVSYALLAPAILCVLFSFNLFGEFDILGVAKVRYNLTRENGKPSPVTESMWQLISLLIDTGGYLGAVLVVVYSMVVPTIKLLLLLLGECWRNSKDPTRVMWARRSIVCVQFVSKWASPDMFAYIMILHLFKGLNHPPKLQAKATLDVAFVAFCLFCTSSTISTLGISLPQVEAPTVSKSRVDASWARKGAIVPVSLLTVGFTVLFVIGASRPCMSVNLNTDSLVGPGGPVPENFREQFQSLGLASLVDTTVSLRDCIAGLMTEEMVRDATLMMAFVLLAVFVVILTLLDMVFIVLAAVRDFFATAELKDEEDCGKEQAPNVFLEVASVLKHVCMLDVFIMGVVVVCSAGAPYAEQGVAFRLEAGMFPLLGAELCHYAAYHIVSSAHEHE